MLLFLVTLKNFQCLYSHYGSCMPSSPKEYIEPLAQASSGPALAMAGFSAR